MSPEYVVWEWVQMQHAATPKNCLLWIQPEKKKLARKWSQTEKLLIQLKR